MKALSRVLFLVPCLSLVFAGASAALIESRFDTGSEGWTIGSISDSGSGWAIDPRVANPPNYDPAARLIQTYDVFGWTTFRSSAAYGGDRTAFFGGSISYDLSDSYNDAGWLYPNIAILAGNGAMIFIPTEAPSTTGFTHYDFALDSSAGWLTGSLVPAPDSLIRAVLSDVVGFWINADWKSGDNTTNDDSRLDNVCLRESSSSCTGRPIPAPETLALLGFALTLLGVWPRPR